MTCIKLKGILLAISLSIFSQAKAETVSIKLDLTQTAQDIVKEIVDAGSLGVGNDQGKIVAVSHVSIGFVENVPDAQTAITIGDLSTVFINSYLKQHPLEFDVDSCDVKFGKHTVLVPTGPSASALKDLNLALEKHLNQNGYQLNALTTNASYSPHLSLKNGTTGANRIKSMNDKLNHYKSKNGGNLFFKLKSSSYTVRH